MKRTVILAAAAALVLSGVSAVKADDQKAAEVTKAAATQAAPAKAEVAKTEAAKPATNVATATKPAATTGAVGTTEATATKPAPTATTTTTTTTTPAGTKVTVDAVKTTVLFAVEGPKSAEEFNQLKTHLAKAQGVSQADCNYAAKTCSCVTTKTPEELLTWVKSNYANYQFNLKK